MNTLSADERISVVAALLVESVRGASRLTGHSHVTIRGLVRQVLKQIDALGPGAVPVDRAYDARTLKDRRLDGDAVSTIGPSRTGASVVRLRRVYAALLARDGHDRIMQRLIAATVPTGRRA